MSEFDLTKPQSRAEKILGKMTKDYSGELDPPQSRVEAYLSKLSEGGGGTGGDSSDGDYVTIGFTFKGSVNDFPSQGKYIITKNKINSLDVIETTSDLYASGYYIALIVLGNFMTIQLPKSNDVFYVYLESMSNNNFILLNQFIPDKDKNIEFDEVIIYGYEVDPTIENPSEKVTYLSGSDNESYIPFKMDLTTGKPDYGSWKDAFFMPRSCMLRSDGTVAYYLDENDETKKEDGTPSDVSNPDFDGNAMMEFGRDGRLIWTKIEPTAPKTGNVMGYKVYISNYKLDDNYHAWAFHDANGKLVPHFYMPKYNSSLIDGKFRSLSGQHIVGRETTTAYNAAQEMNYAKANGTGWLTETKAQVDLVNILLILMAKSTNSQIAYGNGHIDDSHSNTNLLDTGSANTKGMFYGTSGYVCVKVFGMENWWGNQWRRYAGHMMINGIQKVKLTYGTEDGSTVVGYNTTGDGYITIEGATLLNKQGETSGAGYIKEMKASIKGTLVPTGTLNGSSSTNYCDYCWYDNTSTIYAYCGGALYFKEHCGVSCVNLSNSPDNARWGICANITCTPAINELDIEDKYVKPVPN